jgi:hypothetical protein
MVARNGVRLRLIGFVTTLLIVAATPALDAQLFRPFSLRDGVVLEGNWQSCREHDGEYAERVYDNNLPGIGPFEVHLGPYHDFAVFRGVQEEHRSHQSSDNLLKPHTVAIEGNRARQEWEVGGLKLEVTLAGGSRAECESWFVTLRRTDHLASH